MSFKISYHLGTKLYIVDMLQLLVYCCVCCDHSFILFLVMVLSMIWYDRFIFHVSFNTVIWNLIQNVRHTYKRIDTIVTQCFYPCVSHIQTIYNFECTAFVTGCCIDPCTYPIFKATFPELQTCVFLWYLKDVHLK